MHPRYKKLASYFATQHISTFPVQVVIIFLFFIQVCRYKIDHFFGPGISPAAILCALFVSAGMARMQQGRYGTLQPVHHIFQLLAAVLTAGACWLLTSRLIYVLPQEVVIFPLAAGLLFVFVAPSLRTGTQGFFWQNCLNLFIAGALGIIFSAILYGGLALAYTVTASLFGFQALSRVYEYSAYTVFFLLYPLFMLGQLQVNYRTAENPPLLKIVQALVRYILLPILVLYFIIIMAYCLRVLFSWQLPRGQIGYLCFGFAAYGIVAYFLNKQLYHLQHNRLSAFISRWFWWGLLLVMPIHFIAMYQRVSIYGLTPGRYMGLVVLAWLAVNIIYFITSRRPQLQALFISTIAFCVMLSLPPLQPHHAVISTQLQYLSRNLNVTTPFIAGQKADRLNFLIRNYGLKVLNANPATAAALKSAGYKNPLPPDIYSASDKLLTAFRAADNDKTTEYVRISTTAASAFSTSSGAVIFNYNSFSNSRDSYAATATAGSNQHEAPFSINGISIKTYPADTSQAVNITVNNQKLIITNQQLQPLLRPLYQRYTPGRADTLITENPEYRGTIPGFKYTWLPQRMSLVKSGNNILLDSYSAWIILYPTSKN